MGIEGVGDSHVTATCAGHASRMQPVMQPFEGWGARSRAGWARTLLWVRAQPVTELRPHQLQ